MSGAVFLCKRGADPFGPHGTPSSRCSLLSFPRTVPELHLLPGIAARLISREKTDRVAMPGVCRGGTGAPDRRHQLLRTAQGYRREDPGSDWSQERRDADGVEGRYRGPDRQDFRRRTGARGGALLRSPRHHRKRRRHRAGFCAGRRAARKLVEGPVPAHGGKRSPEDRHNPMTLIEAEQYTRKLATTHYENFHVVSFLLPKHLHQDFYNVYAYCRSADDLADEIPDTEESLSRSEERRVGKECR